MDKIRSKPSASLKKRLLPALAIALVGFVSYIAWSMSSEHNYSARLANLSIASVERGELSVSVKGTGLLVPQHVRWVAANVSGRVDAIYRKPGAELKAGEVILRLSNPELVQDVEELKWELEAESAQNRALEVDLASRVLDQEAQVLAAEMDYESARIKLEAEKTLLDEGNATVSKIEYQRSQLATRQFLNRWKIEKQRLEQLKENKTAQLAAADARLNRLHKIMTRAEEQVQSLTVKAPSDGVLQALPLEPGQQVLLGSNMAKMADQNALIAELLIAERRIRDVRPGQLVTIDTRQSQINGTVIRVDPAVHDGTVQVDVAFTDALPEEARPDLSVDGTIFTAKVAQTLYVGRPYLAQNSASAAIFKLSSDQRSAEKITVQFGIGSSEQIQVLSGLQPGDQIILSDSSQFQHLNQIRIQ